MDNELFVWLRTTSENNVIEIGRFIDGHYYVDIVSNDSSVTDIFGGDTLEEAIKNAMDNWKV